MAKVDVYFFNFDKKLNSTARPTPTSPYNWDKIECLLKDECSGDHPVLVLSGLDNPFLHYFHTTAENNYPMTYAWIPSFNSNYYFIDDWTYYEGTWTCSLSIDVLASYKNDIGNGTFYVTRSASDKDDTILDTMYPTKGGVTITENSSSSELYDKTNGTYILGVFGKRDVNTLGVGSINYYTFSATELADFMNWLWGDGFYNAMTDGGQEQIEKALLDPTKYIANAMFVPFDCRGASIGIMKLGWWSSQDASHPTGYFTVHGLSTLEWTTNCSITVPKNGQASTRGSYLNLSPYSNYELISGVWGDIPLSSTDLMGISTLYVRQDTDLTTGQSRLSIRTTNGNGKLLYTATSELGVPVPLASIVQNTVGIGTSVVKGLADSNIPNMQTNIGKDIANAISSIASTVQSGSSSLSTASSLGSRIALIEPKLIGRFYTIVDDNNDHVGSPLCKEKQISTLSGYVQIADADIAPIGATPASRQALQSYMENGFFYE